MFARPRIVFFSTSIISSIFLIGCGGGGSSGISDIASLPKATAGVTTSTSSSSTFRAAATTGVLLKNWLATNWDNTKSLAMCEVGAITKNVLREAGEPDKVLCYIGQMERHGIFS